MATAPRPVGHDADVAGSSVRPLAGAGTRVAPSHPGRAALETFEGQAWVGIAPFVISGLRARAVPAIPGVSGFPEINVRTYVTAGGKPGVFFFSLRGGLRRAEIHHPPGPLQPAHAEIRRNTMTEGLSFRLPDVAPMLHFARRLHVHVWLPASIVSPSLATR